MEIRVYNHLDSELESHWRKLEKISICSIFQTFDWVNYWLACFSLKSNFKLNIYLIYKNSKPVALFPFYIKNYFFIKTLEFLGSDLLDFGGPLIDKDLSEEDISRVWQEIINQKKISDIIYLQRIPCRIYGLDNPFNISVTKYFLNKANINKLPSSEKNLKKRKDNIRKIKKLNQIDTLKYEVVNNYKDSINTIERLFELKSLRYEETGANDIFSNISFYSFFKYSFLALDSNPKIHISRLMLGNEIIAAHLGYIYNKTFYYILPAFESNIYARYSPGRLLLEYLVKDSVNSKLNFFDLTIGGEIYKNEWSNDTVDIWSSYFPTTILGKVVAPIFNLYIRIRRNVSFKNRINKIRAYIRK